MSLVNIQEKNFLQVLIHELSKCKGNNIYIQTHDNPDPDAVGSAIGLKNLLSEFGIGVQIIYGGQIVKKSLIRMMAVFEITLIPLSEVRIKKQDVIIYVDCQYRNINVTHLEVNHRFCIDHHEFASNLNDYVFAYIEPDAAACCSLIAEMYIINRIPINERIAGMLYYGIKIDSNDLLRDASSLDRDVYYYLSNIVKISDIKKIELSKLSISELNSYAKGMKKLEKYEDIVFSRVKECDDNLLGSMGDILLSLEEVNIVVLYSVRADGVKFSIRSNDDQIRANELVQFILKGIGSGGGHMSMAGGVVDRKSYELVCKNKKFSTYVKVRTIEFCSQREDRE